ncbi:MAG: hypothetical protein ACI36Y_09700 [Coriobacteriales bacterium]
MGLGIEGLAYATMLSTLIGYAVTLSHGLSKKCTIRPDFSVWRRPREALGYIREEIVIGGSSAIVMGLYGLLVSVICKLIGAAGGTIGLAAWGVYQSIVKFFNAFSNGAGRGVSLLTGLLAQQLQLMGFSTEGSQLVGFEPFAAQGFVHDVQFAFDEHGPLEETLAFSLVPGGGAGARAQRMRSGDIAQMLAFLEEQGLANARWRELLPAMGTWMLPCVVDGAAVPLVAGFGIGYAKFRWSNGAPAAPAKLYIKLRASIPHKEA